MTAPDAAVHPTFSTLDAETFRVYVAVMLRNGDTSALREKRKSGFYLALANDFLVASYAMGHPLAPPATTGA